MRHANGVSRGFDRSSNGYIFVAFCIENLIGQKTPGRSNPQLEAKKLTLSAARQGADRSRLWALIYEVPR
jgi:hypothetical protein